MLNGRKTSQRHYTSKLNGLRMIPTFLNFCQVMDIREFFRHCQLFTLRLPCFGWTVMVRMKLIIAILLRTYNISRDKIVQVLELCEVLLINIWLPISISSMLMLLCVFSKDDYSKSPKKTPSFVSKFFFQTKKITHRKSTAQDEALQMAPPPPADFSTEDRTLHEVLEDFYWRNRPG